MSSVSSQVKRLVEERMDTSAADDASVDTLSRSELKEVVREGVLEALEEQQTAEQEAVKAPTSDDDVEQTTSGDESEQKSSGKLSLKKLFLFGVVAILLYRRNQQKNTSETA